MIDFLLQILQEIWTVFKEASLFLLFGYIIGVLLNLLIPAKTFLKYLGAGKIRSVFWASLLGVPLPLCSCGVLPTALSLRKQGATKGATVSFLISTPETGVDSISLSYALMDPIMTVVRPIAAFFTAMTAGIVTNFWGDDTPGAPRTDQPPITRDPHPDLVEEGSLPEPPPQLETLLEPPAVTHTHQTRRLTYWIQEFYKRFLELIDETSYWLVLGVVLSGIIAALLPASFIEKYLSGGFTTMLLMLLIGIPIYTCASASTPIAATLILKGLNPGAALVFLLSGPATNIGAIVVLLKFLGRKVVALYLGSIVVISLLAGYIVNWIYLSSGLDPRATFGTTTSVIPERLKIIVAIGMIGLFISSIRRTHIPEEWIRVRDWLTALTGLHVTTPRIKWGVIISLVLLYLYSGFITVEPGEIGVKLRFGRIVSSDLTPGLHYHLPWPVEKIEKIHQDLVRRVEIGFRTSAGSTLNNPNPVKTLTVAGPSNPAPTAMTSMTLWAEQKKVENEAFLITGDENIVDINLTVQYQIKDPVQYAYRFGEPDRLVRGMTLAGLREVIGQMMVDSILTTERGNIEKKVQRILQDALDGYQAGIQVLFVQLLSVDAPREVHSAFRDVASAQEDKIHIINRALTFAEETINAAKGEAASTIQSSLAFKEEKILKAQGDAQAFLLRNQAYQLSPELNQFRLYIETLETVLPRVQKTIRPGPRYVKDVDLWMIRPLVQEP
jgi:HflK protein